MEWNLRNRILIPSLAPILAIALVLVPFLMGRAYVEASLDDQLAALANSALSTSQ